MVHSSRHILKGVGVCVPEDWTTGIQPAWQVVNDLCSDLGPLQKPAKQIFKAFTEILRVETSPSSQHWLMRMYVYVHISI